MFRSAVLFSLLATFALTAQDASNIAKPSQSDMLVGTRVPRELAWSAPTPKERWRVWWRGIAASPGSYVRSTVSAGFMQLNNTPEEYRQGWGAYGKRFGNSFLTYSLQDSASQAMAAGVGYEMRYVQCKCTKVLPRIGHAFAYNFVTLDRNGKRVLNWPALSGGYLVGMVSSTYTPGQKWSAGGLRAGNSAIYFGFASSLLQEFTPSKLFKRRAKKQDPVTNPNGL